MKLLDVLILLALFPIGSEAAMESIYTDLTEKECPVMNRDEESGSTRQLCPGVAEYKLAILNDDDRVSIDVVFPDGKEYPLNYWDVISQHFTTHGDKAEWRVVREGKKLMPKALIIRVKAFEDPNNPEKFISYLAVSKITSEQACVTAKIKPGRKQNEMARRVADVSTERPCLKRPPAPAASFAP